MPKVQAAQRQYLPVPVTATNLLFPLNRLDPTKKGWWILYQPDGPGTKYAVWRHAKSFRETNKHNEIQTIALGGPFFGVVVFSGTLGAAQQWYWVSYGINVIS